MIAIRRARPGDAVAIASVHVTAWRSAYAGLLPDHYLAQLSLPRYAARYDAAIHAGEGVFVALTAEPGPRVVGFLTTGPARVSLAEAEIETLYVLDDWREQGAGRRLMRAAAEHLSSAGLSSVFLWVLRDNPSRWFYQRLGGRMAAESTIRVGGARVVQVAYVWDSIEQLNTASPLQS